LIVRRFYYGKLLGYTRRSVDRTSEYRIEHPRWKIWPPFRGSCAQTSRLRRKFVAPLTAPPASAFIADGSFVTIYRRGTTRTCDLTPKEANGAANIDDTMSTAVNCHRLAGIRQSAIPTSAAGSIPV